jgi:hypothetical protein
MGVVMGVVMGEDMEGEIENPSMVASQFFETGPMISLLLLLLWLRVELS